MGCGSSTPAAATPPKPLAGEPQAGASNSRKVDNAIQKAKQEEERKIKILLLGAGGSGKSTIFKQMRLMYGTERSDDDLRMYGVVARSNTVVAVRKLCSQLRNLGLEEELDKESAEVRQAYNTLVENLVDAKKIDAASIPEPDQGGKEDWVGKSARAGVGANKDSKLLLAYWRSMEILWQSNTMKQVWEKRADVNVVDAHKDFLDEVSRLASADYKPTIQDVLIARIRTTQVIMEKFKRDGVNFEMYDVGGQRSERRKWIDCFDSVTAVIFVAALSVYDQVLAEADQTNRLVESLELFKSVCNNRAFTHTSILLFLNMKDIFAQKIMHSDIAEQTPFGDFAGPRCDYDHGVRYFVQKFKDCVLKKPDFNDSFIHVTCATDTSNMEFVMDSTKKMIMAENLKRIM